MTNRIDWLFVIVWALIFITLCGAGSLTMLLIDAVAPALWPLVKAHIDDVAVTMLALFAVAMVFWMRRA